MPLPLNIVIPTYQRVDVFRRRTYALLSRYGLLDCATLYVQDDDDHTAYSVFGLPIVRAPRRGLLDTVNYIQTRHVVGAPIVYMHDDVRQVVEAIPATRDHPAKLAPVECLRTTLNNVYAEMDRNRHTLGGFYPAPQVRYMMSERKVSDDLRFIHDPITITYNQRLYLTHDLKQDYERTLKHYLIDGGVTRMNHLTFLTNYNTKDTQGGYGHRDKSKDKEANDAIVQMFPRFVRSTRENKNGYSIVFNKCPKYEKVTLSKWGYVTSQPKDRDTLEVFVRSGTSDDKVVKEVLTDNVYQKRKHNLIIEPSDCWLDLGANIGTFGLLVLSIGGKVVSVEPDPSNVHLLRRNLTTSYPGMYHPIITKAVDKSIGERTIFKCNDSKNNWRHSFILQHKRTPERVQTYGLRDLLDVYTDVNAVKMDIEGAEIELLEYIEPELFKNRVQKLVFEYSWDADRRITRFTDIIKRLKRMYAIVFYKGVDTTKETYDHFPASTMVYCSKLITYKTYDIRHRLLQFESTIYPHKNVPHIGDRYAMVFFNKPLNYTDTIDERTQMLQDAPNVCTQYLPTCENDKVRQARTHLLNVMSRVTFPCDRCGYKAKPHAKYGTTPGRFLSFGVTQSRKARKEREAQGLYNRASDNMNNDKYPELYDALNDYMSVYAPGVFGKDAIYQSCIIAHNAQCEWHTDAGNVGHAAICTVGEYTRGDIMILGG